MQRDITTDTLARLGLLNQSFTFYDGADGKCVAASDGADIIFYEGSFLEYVREAEFEDACARLSEMIAGISHDEPDAYDSILLSVSEAGTEGMAVMRPVNNVWPDAMLSAIPEIESLDYFDVPSRRCFPALHAAIAMSSQEDRSGDYAWLADNPGSLSLSFEGSDAVFTGWSSNMGQPVSFRATSRNLAIPWRIYLNPDMSETATEADVLELADESLNIWRPKPAKTSI